MRRWTDGRRWGASRVGGGGFLVYTEYVGISPESRLGLSLVACRIELTHLGRRITCPLHRPEEPGRITWADPTAAMDTRRTAVQR